MAFRQCHIGRLAMIFISAGTAYNPAMVSMPARMVVTRLAHFDHAKIIGQPESGIRPALSVLPGNRAQSSR